MAISGAAQALIAVFSFGILFNAASAGLVLYVKGHGSTIFRDGLRLVLILFLGSSTFWALVEFLATLIDPTAASTCQVAVIFSTLFDQLGRAFIEQYVVWAVRKDGEKTAFSVLPQILVFARLFLGIAFVGLTRPDFNPTCVPVTDVQPIAIAVIALDAVILILLAIHASSAQSTKNAPNDQQVPGRSKAVLLVIVGLTIWMGTSVTLLLGIGTIDLFFRTTLPAIGLIILIAFVAIFFQTLVVTREPPRRPDSPLTHGPSGSRDLSSSDTAEYPPMRYEDLKQVNTMSVSAFTGARNSSRGIPRMTPDEPSMLPQIPEHANGDMDSGQKHKGAGRVKNKSKGGKLEISHPVIKEEEGVHNPLKRMPTVDLATAADNERIRREQHAEMVSALIAKRPAPKPPTVRDQGAELNRAASSKRKEIAPTSPKDLVRSESTKTIDSSGGLSAEVNASSTATQLSPGTDALRRRSPRQTQPVPTTSTFQPIRPGEPIRVPIPRAPEPAQPEPAEIPEPVKTPLQRRATTGLPRNPRAQAMKATTKEGNDQRQQTVMFVNNIVYDDPNAVNDIMQGTSKTPLTSLDSRGSMVHRPRPIPRNSDHDRQVFPAEASPNPKHRRSKSLGSVASRKSILQSMPGSPTQLPPLPPPPKTAGTVVARPLPNDTNSMTFDEKMNFLYSGPTSAPSTSSKRRSSVPALPPLPVAFVQDGPQPAARDSETNDIRRVSKTTDRSSLRTASILGVEDVPQQHLRSVSSSQNAVDELGNSWLPGIPFDVGNVNRPSYNDTKRQSSPVIPAGRQLSMSTTRSEARTRDEVSTTNWGSVHSPVAPVDIQQSRLNPRATYIRKNSSGSTQERNPHVPSGVGGEVMTVMLDTSLEHTFDNRGSFYLGEDEKSLPDVPAAEIRQLPQFHHRVGEQCPTFSTAGRSRKMPPPPPLLLNGQSMKRTVIVQAAEPSPLESPEAAYQTIQAQLEKFEQPKQESVEDEETRLALLENLELEMGELENKWQSNRVDRDSLSTVQTSPSKDSRPNSTVSRRSSQRSIAAERRASRRSRLRSGSTVRPREDDSTGPLSSDSFESTQTGNVWQARLAEAQMEYMDNAPDLIMKRNNMNFLSVSKAALGSPSPPETDDESESEIRKSAQILSARLFKSTAPVHELWKPSPASEQLSPSGLWVAGSERSAKVNEVQVLPGLSVRPAIRKSQDALKIESSQLWSKPMISITPQVSSGLWRKAVPEQRQQLQTADKRPTIVRPPRVNKRVTLLPDILENPEPLPDKRGTLGIFQFPWGEKSEHPTIQYRAPQMFMAMPGTMASGGRKLSATLEARAKQIEADEYSTSFFEDYEEEEEGDDLNFSDAESEGDDFDETTLWEIASLLQGAEVPSKNSLLPAPLQGSSPVDTDLPAELEMMPEEPVPVQHASMLPPQSSAGKSLLWNSTSKDDVANQDVGLPQPDAAAWEAYVPEACDVLRAQPRTEEIAHIESTNLWTPPAKVVKATGSGLLWTANAPVAPAQSEKTAEASGEVPSLWNQPESSPVIASQGLFDINRLGNDLRRTSKDAAALSMTRKPRASEQQPLVQLKTTGLWAKEYAPVAVRTSKHLFMGMSTPTETIAPVQSSLLWEQSESIPTPVHNGLFDIHVARIDYRRSSKVPAAITMTRKPRRTAGEALPPLESESLWTQIAQPPAPVLGPLFVSKKSPTPIAAKPEADSTMVQPVAQAQPISLWSKPEEISEAVYSGLFDASAIRVEYRRTSKSPAAITLVTKPRKSEEHVAILESKKLWAVQPRATEAVASNKNMLWAKRPSVASKGPTLFQLDPERTDFRTTSAEPAALEMVRKARNVEAPLQRLQSTNLWVSGQADSVELDWMTISSVRPRSPSLASVSDASSSPSSPTTDASSVKSSTTKASSVSGKSSGGFFGGWWGKRNKKETKVPEVPKLPEVAELDLKAKIPEVPQDFVVKNLDEVRREKPVAHRQDWDAALLEAIVASYPGTMVALRASYPRDWDSELHEAIKASHIAPKLVRRAATPRDWSMALHSAISESYPQLRFSRGQALPSQWDAEILAAIAKSQVVQPEVSVKRERSFTRSKEQILNRSRSVTRNAVPVPRVPTMPAVPAPKSLLWVKPAQTSTVDPSKGMWDPSSTSTGAQTASLSGAEVHLPRKGSSKNLSAEIQVSPDFGKQGMWKRVSGSEQVSNHRSQEKNWLEATL